MENGTSPRFGEALRVWARLGLLSFGGPAAQIALMHRMLVEERPWLTEKQFLDALSFCMLLPGPEAMQLATYAGWRLHGTRGGLAAGLLFVLPGALVILALACLYALLGDVPLVSALFLGIKATVLIIVLEALVKVSRRALKSRLHWAIAGLALVGIMLFQLPFPLIVLAAGLVGLLATRATEADTATTPPRVRGTLAQALAWLAIWWVPLLLLDLSAAPQVLSEIGYFFSRLAVVTFGGAYAVLTYMGQDVVERFGWLVAGEMMDGLGLAETTPGPLILVTEFVGFLAAFREGGVWLGIAGALVTLWATFVPCFLWIFTAAPYVSWIGTRARLRGALAAITAAVVGVILNLAIWFGLHVFFGTLDEATAGPVTLLLPDPATLDLRVVVLAGLSALMLLVLRLGLVTVLGIAAGLGALTAVI